jgi:hypothetical protein
LGAPADPLRGAGCHRSGPSTETTPVASAARGSQESASSDPGNWLKEPATSTPPSDLCVLGGSAFNVSGK